MVIAGLLLGLLIGAGAWLYTPDVTRAALEAKYHVAAADYLELDGIRLRVVTTGPVDAPAAILLHGFGSSLETWDAWAGRLSAQFRVIRFDLPGFGLTGPDPTGDYSDRRSLQVLLDLMDRLDIGQATLIGNSLGGKLAWQFAAAFPQRVHGLVLISPDGFASPGFEYGRAPKVPVALQFLPYVLPAWLVRVSLAPAYGDPKRLPPGTVARYRDFMRAPGVRRAMIMRMQQIILEDPRPELASIRAPTLIVWGKRDGMIPFSNAADYLRAIPHAMLEALPRLGHVPFEEAPDESIARVFRFIQASDQI